MNLLKQAGWCLFWLGRAAMALFFGGVVAALGGGFGIGTVLALERPDSNLAAGIGMALMGVMFGSEVAVIAYLFGAPALAVLNLFGLKYSWARTRLAYTGLGIAISFAVGFKFLTAISAGTEAYKILIFAICAGLPSGLMIRSIMELGPYYRRD